MCVHDASLVWEAELLALAASLAGLASVIYKTSLGSCLGVQLQPDI